MSNIMQQFVLPENDERIRDVIAKALEQDITPKSPKGLIAMRAGRPFFVLHVPGDIENARQVQQEVWKQAGQMTKEVWGFQDRRNIFICVACPKHIINGKDVKVSSRISEGYYYYKIKGRPPIFAMQDVLYKAQRLIGDVPASKPQVQKPVEPPAPKKSFLEPGSYKEVDEQDEPNNWKSLHDDLEDEDRDEPEHEIHDEEPEETPVYEKKTKKSKTYHEDVDEDEDEADDEDDDIEEEDDDEEPSSGFSKLWLIPITLFLIAGVLFGLYFYRKLDNGFPNPFTKTPAPVENQIADSQVEDILNESSESVTHVDVTPSEPVADETAEEPVQEEVVDETSEEIEEETPEEVILVRDTDVLEDTQDEVDEDEQAIEEEETSDEETNVIDDASSDEMTDETSEEVVEEPVEETTQYKRGIVTANTLTIRKTPDPSGETIGYIEKGAEMVVTDADSYPNWIEVEFEGNPGYVFARYLTVED